MSEEPFNEFERLRDEEEVRPPDLRRWAERWALPGPEHYALLADMEWIIENQDFKDEEQFLRSQVSLVLTSKPPAAETAMPLNSHVGDGNV